MIVIFEQVKEIIREQLYCHDEELTMDTKLSQIDATALDVTEILLEIEDIFEVEFPDDGFEEDAETVGDILKYVEKAVQQNNEE